MRKFRTLTQLPSQESFGYHSESVSVSSISSSVSSTSCSSTSGVDMSESSCSSSLVSVGSFRQPRVLHNQSSNQNISANEMSWNTTPRQPISPLALSPTNKVYSNYYHPFHFPNPNTGVQLNLAPQVIRKRQRDDESLSFSCLENSVKQIKTSEPEMSEFDSLEVECTASNSFDDSFSFHEDISSYPDFRPFRASTPDLFTSIDNSSAAFPAYFQHLNIDDQDFRPNKRKLESYSEEQENAPKVKKLRTKLKMRNTGDKENCSIMPRITVKGKRTKTKDSFCKFCKDNGETPVIYNHHTLMDAKGRTLCPVLRQIVCPTCNADGDNAHTLDTCPQRDLKRKSLESLSVSCSWNYVVSHVRRSLSFLKL